MSRSRQGPEDDLQDTVVALARLYNWRVFFIPNWMYRLAIASVKRSRVAGRNWPDKGCPDLILLKPPYFMVIELKSVFGKNRLSPEQKGWLNDLLACGIDARVWRETDRDEIDEALMR